MRRIILLLLLLPIFSFSQTRQTGGISFTPQWNYKISGSDTTWQFGNTLINQFPYFLTRWQSDQRYALKSGSGYIPYTGAIATFNRNQQNIIGSFTGGGITYSDLLAPGSWAQNVHDSLSTYSMSNTMQSQNIMFSNVPSGIIGNTVFTRYGLDNTRTYGLIDGNVPFKFNTPFVGLATARGAYSALEFMPKQRTDSLYLSKSDSTGAQGYVKRWYLTNQLSGKLSGSGTQNYIPKFGIGGASLGNSTLIDNGTFTTTANPFEVKIGGSGFYFGSGGGTGAMWAADVTSKFLTNSALFAQNNYTALNAGTAGVVEIGIDGGGQLQVVANDIYANKRLNLAVTPLGSVSNPVLVLNNGVVDTIPGGSFAPSTGSSVYVNKTDSGNVANNYVTYGKYLYGSNTLVNKFLSGNQNTFTNIPNSGLTNSTISGISLGSNLATLTFGAHLITGGSSYNGSTAVTITSDATNANTANAIVSRGASGQIAVGAIASTGVTSTSTITAGSPLINSFIAPSVVASGLMNTGPYTTFGVANSTNNAFAMQFTYAGAGSNNNRMSFGIISNNPWIDIYSNRLKLPRHTASQLLATDTASNVVAIAIGNGLSYTGGTISSTTSQIRLTGSGTGAATTISIPHGLSGVTSASIALVQPINAASAGVSYITTDATNINIVYTVAPASGTNNLSYNVSIKP